MNQVGQSMLPELFLNRWNGLFSRSPLAILVALEDYTGIIDETLVVPIFPVMEWKIGTIIGLGKTK